MFNPSNIPQHISTLVNDLEQVIRATTAPGTSGEVGENYSLLEDDINLQLRALGWDAVLSDTGRWMPIPSGFTIINNPPDPYFYPQRCYHVPEGPDQWRALWESDREVCFTTWRTAYAFVFTYLAQEQAGLPLKRFRVRPPATSGGNDYVASNPEQALQLHLNNWLFLGWITARRAVELQFDVFEHCGSSTFYCRACQHAPCKYTPGSQWPMPASPGWISSSL